MGDNRDNSYDSRFWGFVKKQHIKSKALYLQNKRGGKVEVYISPTSLEDAAEDIQEFIADRQVPAKTMWVVANWKVGFFIPMGILLFCLTAFVIGVWSIVTGNPLDDRKK